MDANEQLDPSTSSVIRATLYAVLAEYAERTTRRSVTFYSVFSRTIHYLNEKNAFNQRLAFVSNGAFDLNTFPDSGVEAVIATIIRREFWELYLQKIIAPAPTVIGQAGHQATFNTFFSLDNFVVTPYGMSVIAEFPNRIQVHDPTGYLANFTAAAPAPDPVLMRYLTEAVHTFRDGHLLASVVLLATASDRLLDLVALQVSRVQGGSWYNQTYKPNSAISSRFDALVQKLRSDFGADLDQINVKDTLNTVVPPVFNLIRTARNDIAHPSGREFTWNEVSGFLHMFVGYFLCFNQIIGVLALKANAP